MTERRKEIRFKTNLLMSIVYRDEDNSIVTEEAIFSEDISAGGLRILFPHQLPKGKVLDLKLFLFSDPIHLPTQGKVVWSNRKQALEVKIADGKKKQGEEVFWVGIQFINVDQFTQQRILRWLKSEFNIKEA